MRRSLAAGIAFALSGCAVILGLPDPALDEGAALPGEDAAAGADVLVDAEPAIDANDAATGVDGGDAGIPLTGLAYRFRADVGVVRTNGIDVDRWIDQSPEAKPTHDAVLSSVSSIRPTLSPDAFGSGIPGLRFPGGLQSAKLVTQAPAAETVMVPFTGYIVARADPNASVPLPKVFGSAPVQQVSLALNLVSPVALRTVSGGVERRVEVSAPFTDLTKPVVVAFVVRSVDPNLKSRLYLSTVATPAFSGQGDLDAQGVARFGIGGTGDNTPDGFTGDVGEVLVYRGAHDDATRAAITMYLAARYGVALN